jgi:AcrR family transcriptional regulator
MGRDGIRVATALAPRQLRSRETYEELISAAERLLAKSGANEFTLLGVSQESGVSIGGI